MNFKKEIYKTLKNAVNIDINIELIEVPPNPNMGDYAFPCFTLAKELKKSPIEISKEIVSKVSFIFLLIQGYLF